MERTDLERTVRRRAKTNVVFWKAGDTSAFYSIKGSYTPESAKRIREFYGDAVHIWNETETLPENY